MSKHDNSIITEAAPHTIKKFELIESYVDEWARKILGFGQSKGVIYIDCMSNSGLYYNEKKNLVEGTAIRVARKLNDIIVSYPKRQSIIALPHNYPKKHSTENTTKKQVKIV